MGAHRMNQLGSVLTAVLTITTVIGIALAGLMLGAMKNLRDVNKDLRDEVADRARREAEHVNTIATLTSDLAALGRLARGDAYLSALADRLEEHHEAAEDYWEADKAISQETLDAIKRLPGGASE